MFFICAIVATIVAVAIVTVTGAGVVAAFFIGLACGAVGGCVAVALEESGGSGW